MDILTAVFVVAVIICGIIDYKKYIIPDIITLPLIVAGLVYQILNQGWQNIGFALAVGAVMIILGLLTGGVGGGDIKLIAAIALWMHPIDVLQILIISSLIGVVWGIAKKIKTRGVNNIRNEYQQKLIMLQVLGIKSLNSEGQIDYKYNVVPFGTCLAIGTIVCQMYFYII